MSNAVITPSVLSGAAAAPPSRDDTVRMLFAMCMGDGGGSLGNCHESAAAKDILDIGRQLGCDIYYDSDEKTADIFSYGINELPKTIIARTQIGAKFAAGLALQFDAQTDILCASLPKKAADFIAAAAQGARVIPGANKISAKGPLNDAPVPMPGREGAFWAGPLAMSCAISADETFFELDDYSAIQPSLSSALSVMDTFGIIYSRDIGPATLVVGGDQIYPERYLDAEGDWRNASYILGALLCAGRGTISGISKFSSQNERQAWKQFEELGYISWNMQGDELTVKAGSLPSLPLDPRPAGALLPLWMALSIYANTPISIGPLHPLSPRNQKRIDIMTDGLQTLGATVERLAENVIVHPGKLHGGTVDAKGDPRAAMGFAVAALGAAERITIENIEGVADAYPEFWSSLRGLGADISLPSTKRLTDKQQLP